MSEHKTVFKKEGIEQLHIKENGIYADLTLGGGGHSLKILENKNITLVCVDLDKSNIEKFENKIIDLKLQERIENKTLFLINDNFANINTIIQKLDIKKVDGIIADLGWSSDQFESVPGLSFEDSFAELDMRLSQEFGVKAKDLLNAFSKKELSKMFEEYGDIKGFQNQRLVNSISSFKKNNLFETVEDLNKAIDQSSKKDDDKKMFREKNIDRARIYQSLRIAVNNEKGNLKELLQNGWEVLNEGGSFVIITFHSGEERFVKNFFSKLVGESKAEFTSHQFGEVYTRPSVDELTENLRSRSAKLWSVKKLTN